MFDGFVKRPDLFISITMGQVAVHGYLAKGFVKNFVCKARKPGKGEAYFSYVEPFPGEAQRRRRTFYEAVNL